MLPEPISVEKAEQRERHDDETEVEPDESKTPKQFKIKNVLHELREKSVKV